MWIVVLAVVAAEHHVRRTVDREAAPDSHENVALGIGASANQPISRVVEYHCRHAHVISLEEFLRGGISGREEYGKSRRVVIRRQGTHRYQGVFTEFVVEDHQLSLIVRTNRDGTEGIENVARQLNGA